MAEDPVEELFKKRQFIPSLRNTLYLMSASYESLMSLSKANTYVKSKISLFKLPFWYSYSLNSCWLHLCAKELCDLTRCPCCGESQLSKPGMLPICEVIKETVRSTFLPPCTSNCVSVRPRNLRSLHQERRLEYITRRAFWMFLLWWHAKGKVTTNHTSIAIWFTRPHTSGSIFLVGNQAKVDTWRF